MVIYIYCLFVKLGRKKKRWMKIALAQFGVLLTGSKVITSAATWNAWRSSHLSLSYFFIGLLFGTTGMTQTTLEAFPLCPPDLWYTFSGRVQSPLEKVSVSLTSLHSESTEAQPYPSFRGYFVHSFSGTKSRILQRKILSLWLSPWNRRRD